MKLPDRSGHYGIYGGRYVSETLMPVLIELTDAYSRIKRDPSFKKECDYYLKQYVGRETPLYYAERFSRRVGRAKST
jgi:tryptophan synthase beta chain